MIVDLALSVTGSQLIASVLPTVCPLISSFFLIRLNRNLDRRTKISERSFTSVFGATSSPYVVARLVPRLFGYCTYGYPMIPTLAEHRQTLCSDRMVRPLILVN